MTAVAHSRGAHPALPQATVRSHVTVPLRFPDGYATTAEVMTFHGLADAQEHLLLALGPWEQALLGIEGGAPLVRLHSECMTGDVFGSERCDCGPQLREAVEAISGEGGFLLYLRQEGRGIGLYSKLDAYALQDQGLDTYDANLALGRGEDERDYTAAGQMLAAVGATTVRLLTNNPDKAAQLEGLGIRVAGKVPTGVHLSAANHRYLAAKRDRTAHTLELGGGAGGCRLPDGGTVRDSVPAPAIPGRQELLDRVQALVPQLRERAAGTEELRRLPEQTVQELEGAGVFRMLVPKALGGYGLGMDSYGGVIRLLAQGCASTAWTAGHLAEHAWMLARWPQAAQDEVFAAGASPLAAATGAPVGSARPVPGGYEISGRWTFASGVMHSRWALLAVESDEGRMQCRVPVADVELIDTWHTDGLRGTGSNDLRADRLFVPGYRTIAWERLAAADNPGSRIHADPLIHAPMAALLNVVAPSAALGAAEAALDLFREQLMVRKVKNTVESRQADSPLAQARFAQAFGQLAAARLHWEEAMKLGAEASRAHAVPADGDRAAFRLALAMSAQAAQEAVRLIMAGSGGGAHRLSHPLQRIQRDLGVLLAHPTLGLDPVLEQAGRGLLGTGFTVSSF